MTTFASLYSGIGGADAGFAAAGWVLRWQVEADPFRREALTRHFGVPVYPDVAALAPAGGGIVLDATPLDLESVDVLYADIPDSQHDRWWPAVYRARVFARTWLVLECSPTVRCDAILRDLALDGWAFRLIHFACVIRCDGLEPHECDNRKRALVFAAREGARVDAIGLASMLAELIVSGVGTRHPRLSVRWHEATRGLRDDWSCACGTPDACRCDPAARIAAVGDATSPYATRWIAELIDGTWTDGLDRGVTRADGGSGSACTLGGGAGSGERFEPAASTNLSAIDPDDHGDWGEEWAGERDETFNARGERIIHN